MLRIARAADGRSAAMQGGVYASRQQNERNVTQTSPLLTHNSALRMEPPAAPRIVL